MANILVVDDEPKMTSLICSELEDHKHRVTTSIDPAEALELISGHSFDIVISDLSMPGISGMEIIEKARNAGSDVIMITAHATPQTAVQAMKLGAVDYLIKPVALEDLVILVKKIADRQKVVSLAEHFQKTDRERVGSDMIGSSPATEKVRRMIAQVAKTNSTVLITGRSGTGKELAARMVHDLSPRANKPFIAVNSAALTETLLESELFGHEKGAFTGAIDRKRGRFELADKGSIFLDEIGEIPNSMQTKLLRVLEERQLVRVGGVDTIDIDVRVIVATNRDIKVEVQKGNFREDLYFRLNVFPIQMPSLSERGEDILELAEFFLKKSGFSHYQLDEDVKKQLLGYSWPGNIRELKNILERGMILSGGEPLTIDELSLEIEGNGLTALPEADGLDSTEKEMIKAALAKCNGNKTEAAKFLRISRRRLYSRMKIHDLK